MNLTKKLTKFTGLAIFLLTITLARGVEAGNISSPSYAWSESVGWIKFDTTPGDITVTDSGITGDAYNDNTGWIVLDDITNDGEGNLSGYAWSESVGYIDFSDVTISNNQFQGYAYNDNIGFISLNCSNTETCGDVDYKVTTTWAPAVPETTTTRSSGSSARRRVQNLEEQGKTEEADELKERFPNAFDDTETESNNQNNPSQSNTELSQLIQILISLNLIPEDKVEQARSLMNQPSQNPNFTRDLELNSEGEDVRALQQYLIKAGYSIPAGPTNFFGPQTQSALIQFQIDNNISPAAGYFGPITRGFIN
jgi:hypothetical protein